MAANFNCFRKYILCYSTYNIKIDLKKNNNTILQVTKLTPPRNEYE